MIRKIKWNCSHKTGGVACLKCYKPALIKAARSYRRRKKKDEICKAASCQDIIPQLGFCLPHATMLLAYKLKQEN